MCTWISVDDELPTKHLPVLLLRRGLQDPALVEIWLGHYAGSLWWDGVSPDGRRDEYLKSGTEVTHWMPLPEPPETGRDPLPRPATMICSATGPGYKQGGYGAVYRVELEAGSTPTPEEHTDDVAPD